MLPPPAPKAATQAQPAVEASTAAAPVTTSEKKGPKLVPFGAARGDNAVPVPNIFNLQPKDAVNKLADAIRSITGETDLANIYKTFDATPKSSFPGNKEGKALYAFGRIAQTIIRETNTINKERVAGERKPRVKTTEVFAKGLQAIAANFAGGYEGMLKLLEGASPELAAKLRKAEAK